MGAEINRPWTEDEKVRCVELARSGLSGSQIAAQLGRRRNSIVGFLFRKKVPLMGNSNVKSDAPKKTRKPRHKQSPVHPFGLPPSEPKPPTIVELPVIKPKKTEGYGPSSMLHARPDQCKWVIEEATDGKRAIYCGEPIKKEGCSWCLDHYKIVYIPRSEHKKVIGAFEFGWKKIGASK
jgi:hypothetical protein